MQREDVRDLIGTLNRIADALETDGSNALRLVEAVERIAGWTESIADVLENLEANGLDVGLPTEEKLDSIIEILMGRH